MAKPQEKEPKRPRYDRGRERARLYEAAAYKALKGRVAENLRRVRESRQLTQEAAAERADLAVRVVQRAEAAGSNLSLLTISRLAKGYGVDPAEFLRKLPSKPWPKGKKLS